MTNSSYRLPAYEGFYPLSSFMRALRERLFPTTREAADHIRVNRTTVVRWEKDEAVPELVREYLAYLAKLNVDRYGEEYSRENPGKNLAQDLLDQLNSAITEDDKLSEKKIEGFRDWEEVRQAALAFEAAIRDRSHKDLRDTEVVPAALSEIAPRHWLLRLSRSAVLVVLVLVVSRSTPLPTSLALTPEGAAPTLEPPTSEPTPIQVVESEPKTTSKPVTTTTEIPENLLFDSGFEPNVWNDQGNDTDYWDNYGCEPNECDHRPSYFSKEERLEYVYAGKASCRIDGAGESEIAYVLQDLEDRIPEGDLHLKFQRKTQGDVTLHVKLISEEGMKVVCAWPVENSPEVWHEFVGTCANFHPRGSTYIQFEVVGSRATNVWLDEVSLTTAKKQ